VPFDSSVIVQISSSLTPPTPQPVPRPPNLCTECGWAHILRSGAVGEAETARGLAAIERNAASQARLIDDLFDMSRVLRGKLRLDVKPVDLAALVASAVDVVTPSALTKGIELRLRLVDGLPCFIGDPERLQQVVWNLLSNAVKFTPTGGTVDISLDRTADGGPEIRIRDSGEGIAADFLPHVFERFRQGDPSSSRRHGGMGLGLALVHQLVELHGGTTLAESPGPGQGATFTVGLPYQSGLMSNNSWSTANDELASAPLKGQFVLVVDDEPDARDMLKTLLIRQGATVSALGSMHEALDALGRCTEDRRPVIIVTDLAMPDDDGHALLSRLLSTPTIAGIPVIALTAYASADDRQRALIEGFAAYLTKPVDIEALTTTIVAILSRRGPAPR
jgi:CheY-like chemotaxis protein